MGRRMRKFACLGVILGILIILGLFLPHWHIATGSPAVETIRPTNYYDYVSATTNPTQAYDGNTTTSGNTIFISNNDPSINYGQDASNIDAWGNKSQTWDSAILYATIERELATDDTAGVYIINSAGTEKHTLLALGSSAFSKQEVSQTLNSADWGGSGFPDIYDLRVKVNTTKTKGPDNKYLKIYDIRIEGSYNPLPTVDKPVVTSPMTPQSQAWVNVTITDNNILSDLANVTTILFYDADGSYTDPGVSPSPDTQTLAIMTWYATNDTFTIQSGSPSTWSINNTTSTHDALTGTTGDWKFSFQPGKVATETATPAKWFAKVTAIDAASASGSNNNSATGSTMNFYGEIIVNTATVDFGTVARGSAFADNAKTADVVNIANDNYTANAKTDNGTAGCGHWDNTTAINVTLNATGTPEDGEFSLAIDDSITLASSVNMTTNYQAINSAGVLTSEDGYPGGDHGLWLAMGPAGIQEAVYNGTIYFQIENRA